jgi:MFS family permease
MVRTRGGFYGWWIVGASFLTLFVTVGIGLYTPPVFLVPLQEHFGWSRAAIAAGSAIAAIVSGFTSPLVGVWIDRYGARAVMASGAVLMGLAFALFGLMSSLWQLYALNVFAAVGITCTAWIPNQTLISNWFTRKRGLAMGVALTGIGFGGLVMAPLAGLLIARFGWRVAFAALGALILAVVAVVLAVVYSRPVDLGLRPDGAPAASRQSGPRGGGSDPDVPASMELGEAVRSSAFWILSVANFLSVFATLSIVAHLVAFLTDVGFASNTAAGALGLTVGASVAGRVLFGFLADRFRKRDIMVAGLTVYALATLLLFSIRSAGALPAFVLLFGTALGGTAVLMPLLVGECFGLLAFGKILGLIMISATLGAALGPVLTGRIYDVTGSYNLAFAIHVSALMAAAVAFLFLPKGRPIVVGGAT